MRSRFCTIDQSLAYNSVFNLIFQPRSTQHLWFVWPV
ncbi:hypothetical protein CBNA_1586 [Coxiella burnetii str. Namibia]|nr:hypothetical protein CBNA_1586 [Coxiella burnetii str. Namibia]